MSRWFDNMKSMKKSAKTFIVTLAFLTCEAGALADDSTTQVIKRQAPKGITSMFYECVDKAGAENIALATCLSAEKRRQDARLNTVYKSLLGKLRDTAKENLIRAERAWLEFNNTSQDFESSLYGDESVANLQVTQNGIFRFCERANTLEKYLSIANE